MMTENKSKRFAASTLTQRLVPIILVLLAIGLLVTLGIVILSMLGLTPAV
jgi:phosphotransferase system  glucose/maltose/N-acetylglucosamine-specific IIC component